jgi:2-polyprenyl-3-methyl-5-hydroxy-6-metoxy-1,4-benzoquinol methylase
LWVDWANIKPSGTFLFDHPNRTIVAHLAFIAPGERLLGLISPGTHNSRMFIRPTDILQAMRNDGLRNLCIRGFMYTGTIGGHHRFGRSLASGYFGAAQKTPCA